VTVHSVAADRGSEDAQEAPHLQKGFTGLPARWGDDEDRCAFVRDEAVDGQNCGHCGFSPLAVAVESDAFVVDGLGEHLGLRGFGLEVKELAREIDGVEGCEDEAQGCDAGFMVRRLLWLWARLLAAVPLLFPEAPERLFPLRRMPAGGDGAR